MQIIELIEKAKKTSGLNLGEMAHEMHIAQSAFTAWKKGEYRPGPSEIVYLAEKAELPWQTLLAEMEIERRPEMAPFWKKAVRELRQNQG